MKTPILNALSPRSVLSIAVFVLAAGVFVAACTESAMVAPLDTTVEEDDAFGKAMELPASSEAEVFVIVEDPPKLIGGLTGLQKKIRYPSVECPDTIQGRIFLQFRVTADGAVDDVIVTRGFGDEYEACSREAVRAVQTLRFVPGVQAGKRVPVKMSLPVTFKSNNPEAVDPFDPGKIRRELENGTYEYTPQSWQTVSVGMVSGGILDRNGNQIANALVRLVEYPVSGIVRPNGQYFLRLPQGTWTVEIQTEGGTWQQTVTVQERRPIKLDLREPEK